MIDGTHDYSRHTDHELRGRIYTLPFADQPRNAETLARELEKRWWQAIQQAASQRSSEAITKGAAFSELDSPTAKAFFWRYVRYNVLLGLLFTAAFLCVDVGLSIVNALVAQIATGDATGGLPGLVIFLIASLLLMVPFSRFYLTRVTRKSFGEYGLRIVRESASVPSKNTMEPTREP